MKLDRRTLTEGISLIAAIATIVSAIGQFVWKRSSDSELRPPVVINGNQVVGSFESTAKASSRETIPSRSASVSRMPMNVQRTVSGTSSAAVATEPRDVQQSFTMELRKDETPLYTGEHFPPTVVDLFIPPLPIPPGLQGTRVTIDFEVDSLGRVRRFSFNRTKFPQYDRRFADVLTHVTFRPATTPDGRPVNAKAEIFYDF